MKRAAVSAAASRESASLNRNPMPTPAGEGRPSAATGPSIDHVIAQMQPELSGPNPLNLGVMVGDSSQRLSWRGAAEAAPVLADPAEVFDVVFGDLRPDPALSRLMVDITAVEDGPPAFVEPGVLALQLRLAAQALRFDAARVVTLQYRSSEPSDGIVPWADVPYINFEVGSHHAAVHDAVQGNAAARADVETIATAWMNQYAGLLDQLEAIPEGRGTLLDHTTVVITSEGGALDASAHGSDRLPVVIIGSAGSSLRTGERVEVEGADQADLAISLARAVGIDLDLFGAPEFDAAPIEELFIP